MSRVSRWEGSLVVALFVSLVAILLGAPALLLLAIVPLAYVFVGVASGTPLADLRIERTVDDDRPRPGQPVRVTLSVTNEGDRVCSDVRIVDAVPDAVPVVEGTATVATAVRPDETVTHEYTVLPPRGTYRFGSPRVRARNLVASAVTTVEPAVEGTSALTCETVLDAFSLEDQTIRYVGRAPTDDGGTGIEFYAAREYRHGDPINRIDWHRLARTGELATIEHREERAVTMVFLVDDRVGVHRESLSGGPDSYDLTLYAASRGLLASIEDGNRTGFATLNDDIWIDPGADTTVYHRVEEAIDESTSARRAVADGGSRARSRMVVELEERLPRNAQVVFCTPLTDGAAVDLIEELRLRGRTVTVLSPDMTTSVRGSRPELGARIASLQRQNRIATVRGLGSTVVDWDLADPLSVDLVRAFQRTGQGQAGVGAR